MVAADSAQHAMFLCPSNHSIGELNNALMAAADLRAHGWRCSFMVGRRNLDYATGSGAEAVGIPEDRANEPKVLAQLQAAEPDVVVLSDHHIWCFEPTPVSIDSVVATGLPVLAMDSLRFGPQARTLELAIAKMPGAEPIHRWYPPRIDLPAIPDGVPALYPVPVAGPRLTHAFDKFRSGPTPTASRNAIRERLGVPEGNKLVVAAQSAWAASAFMQLARSRTRRGGDRSSRPTKTYDQLLSEWLANALEATGIPVTVFGVKNWHKPSPNSTVQFASSPFLPTDEFVSLLAAADFYLTDNLTSAAMGQAAYLGVPVLAMVNRNGTSPDPAALAGGPMEAWLQQMSRFFPGFDFPYLVNPYGWTTELDDLRADNPYLSAVPLTEVFDLEDFVDALSRQLTGPPDTRAASELHNSLTDLPGAADVVAAALADR